VAPSSQVNGRRNSRPRPPGLLGIAGDRMVNVEEADVQETVRIIGDMPFTANTRHS
jgi:hypothetical protein